MSASSATSDETRRVMTTVPMDNVVTTLLQHRGHSTLMSLIPGLNKMNWHSNVGHVLDAVLQALGLRRSKDGKEIWTDAAPAKLTYQETKSVNSRQPKQQRHTVAGQLDEIDLAHDARAPAAGSSAAQAAAEAARPPAAPQPLELVDADAGERIGRVGSGWGNTPRSLSACCVCEQQCIDDLAARVQYHARTCSAPLRRVRSEEAQWSSHSMGVVNVCRFTCTNGCVLNWASSVRLPGPPAKPAASPTAPAPVAAAPIAAAPVAAPPIAPAPVAAPVAAPAAAAVTAAPAPALPLPRQPRSSPLPPPPHRHSTLPL